MPGHGSSHRSRRGFTILELLVAMVVIVVVMGMASVFFARQVQLQRAVQSRNDLQDRVRVAMQLVTQDLSLAGAAIRIAADGTIDTDAGAADCAQSGAVRCVDLEGTGTPRDSTLRVRYLSSQFPTGEACRDVAYRFDGNTLLRSDVACGPTQIVDDSPVPTLGADDFIDLAPDMLGFKVLVVCSTGVRVEAFPGGGCGVGYGRSAIVSVGGFSTIPHDGASPTVGFAAADGTTTSATCPAGRVCYGMTQEVLMPNLKDQ